jgi:cytochrome P450
LRSDESLMRAAFHEILRMEGSVQSFSRVALEDWDAGGVPVPQGARLLVVDASANRDERKWSDPEKFDIRRNPVGHLGLGFGLHSCAGQSLARLETQCVITTLPKRVRRSECGEPVMRPNNILRTMKRLPTTVTLI